jgi:hypothetical protein
VYVPCTRADVDQVVADEGELELRDEQEDECWQQPAAHIGVPEHEVDPVERPLNRLLADVSPRIARKHGRSSSHQPSSGFPGSAPSGPCASDAITERRHTLRD